LGMMCEKRDPTVPDRKTLDDASSKELADRLIVPFLDRLEAANPDPVMKKIITNARRYLKNPVNGRPKTEKRAEKETSKQLALAVSESTASSVIPAKEKAEDRVSLPVTSPKPAQEPAELPEVSPTQGGHLWVLAVPIAILLGAAWFGYRRFRKANRV